MMKKTYKREVAGVMLVFLCALYTYGVAFPASTAYETAESLKEFIFLFAGLAFGLDWTSKQLR